MASKLFPFRVRLSSKTGARLTNLSDGGGDPSTHPFHPFLTATSGRFDELLAHTTLDILYGSGVGVGMGGVTELGVGGGGVTDAARCMVEIWITGRPFHNLEVVGMYMLVGYGEWYCGDSASGATTSSPRRSSACGVSWPFTAFPLALLDADRAADGAEALEFDVAGAASRIV